MSARFLVIDGYTREAREELLEGGASRAADLYVRMIERLLPEAECDVLFVADDDAELPQGAALEQYDAVAWTGCSLTVYEDDPLVHRQLDLARAAFKYGIPSFGSCWALQIAVVAAGGLVAAHPDGREMGLARKVQLTPEGRGHPMYIGKASVFDAYISHVDEVTHLPPGAILLAHNPYSRVQAAAITQGKGVFWGVQYHPEYDLYELARLIFCRIDKLLAGGFYKDRAAALAHVDMLEALHREPSRKDLAWVLGLDGDVINDDVRTCEVRNWIEQLVLPSLHR